MHAINANTGAAIWIARPGGPIGHTAAVDNSRVYYGSLDGKVYALSRSNGSVAWTFETGGPIKSAPAVVDGRVFIGSSESPLSAVSSKVTAAAALWVLRKLRGYGSIPR